MKKNCVDVVVPQVSKEMRTSLVRPAAYMVAPGSLARREIMYFVVVFGFRRVFVHLINLSEACARRRWRGGRLSLQLQYFFFLRYAERGIFMFVVRGDNVASLRCRAS